MRAQRFDILRRLKSDIHFKEIMRGTISALAIKIASAGFGFLLSVTLARLLGANGAGAYFFCLSIVTFSGVIARFGLQFTLLRYAAIGVSERNWRALDAIRVQSMIISIPLSILVSSSLYILSGWISEKFNGTQSLAGVISIMGFSVPLLTISVLHAEIIRGYKSIAASLMVVGVIIPVVNIALTIFAAPRFGVLGAAVSYTLAVWFGAIFALIVTSKCKRKQCIGAEELIPEHQRFSWRLLLKSCLPNYATDLIQQGILVSLPVIFLGVVGSPSEVAIFSVSTRIATLISFILIAVNSISGPKFAALHRENKLGDLQRIAQQSSLLMSIMATAAALPILVFPELILNLFGADFSGGKFVLRVLIIGQLVNVAFGSAGLLLTMTGHEMQQRNSVFISAFVLVVMLPVLVAKYGSGGAAVSTALAGLIFNMCAYLAVKNKLGISSSFMKH